MNFSFVYVFLSFLFLTNLSYVQTARFIRNAQTLSCLDLLPSSSSSCIPVTLNPCPTDRFSNFSVTLKWNFIPLNTSSQLTDNSTIMIETNDNQLCLSATSTNNVEACPCDNGNAQKWTLADDKILSVAKPNECLSQLGGVVNVGNCQSNGGPTSWNHYHVAPNAVNLYLKSGFVGDSQQLFINDYNSKFLPQEIFFSPFSLEIPPGFEFVIDSGNNNIKTFDNDVAQMSPINSLTSIISVKLKPGMIIYEQPAYFSASKFMKVGEKNTSSLIIGSVLIPEGLRGVIWSNPNFTGNNLGLFEPIANFTGVSVALKQDFAASLDISATKCKNDCGSGGICSLNGNCSCYKGFAGDSCEQCEPGFYGPTCQQCQCTTVLNKNKCDDSMTGFGKCSCNDGFTGDNCDICAPGFTKIGNTCEKCNCVNGICDEQNKCICNAGFTLDNAQNCTLCKEGYFLSDTECEPCPPGCEACENGKCITCQQGLKDDGNGKCIFSQDQNQSISQPTCTVSFCLNCSGPICLKCQPPKLYLEGSCVDIVPDSGKCIPAANTNQSFIADNAQQICKPCPSTCTDCNIQNFTPTSAVDVLKGLQCTKCIPGHFLNGTECVENCPPGTYANTTNNSCQVCDDSCDTCNGPRNNNCKTCRKDSFNHDGVCSTDPCPSGFVAIDNICKKCHVDCVECSGPGINQCTKCSPERPSLINGQCVEVCPKGTYADGENCQKCNEDCSSCVGPRNDQCLGCNDQTKVLLGGTCSGSCPTGSELVKVEKLCQSLNGEDIIPPGEIIKEEKQSIVPIKLQWWHILIIAGGSLLLLILAALLIRCIAVKRRKMKTKEFSDQIDENAVAQNLKNMLRNARGMPSQPEMSHSSTKAQEVDDLNAPLPAYDNKDGELYWKQRQQRHQKHASINPDDYNNWKQKLKSKDWEGFDIVTEESLSSNNNNNNNAGYSGYNQEEKNTFEAPKDVYRNSKGSLRSNRPISAKRTFDVPIRRDSWI
ncbi:hypothetical protein RhiirA5_393797 [Rhizophagus irregularis]|uniref:Uncharacterized protein n=1 Tax=Rhizophagus irregularis TaxID=588596 RepID=A0A2I1E064_9GLOM|nr:hypothetical protein RhiirA5_393797 [Rhizophagus irregularis]PKC74290.1 hypothetical protein RhiirA1_437048 [Rhizophagus irregularis]PKY15512.1 hypothetical protein RhiirB3_514009 [Rhizophagus irregularis]CAB4475167.1 unnamed protein product [Rhizophagus irregularis]CAB5151419.1 unnamed protein product [Rhizophagus irregularis]